MPASASSTPIASPLATSMRRWRQRMDALDRDLVGLLCQRSTVSVRIARLKHQAGLPLYARGREGEILRQVRSGAKAPLTPVALERIFRAILSEMRSAQRRHARAKKRRRSSCT
jgi:chorismate mutase